MPDTIYRKDISKIIDSIPPELRDSLYNFIEIIDKKDVAPRSYVPLVVFCILLGVWFYFSVKNARKKSKLENGNASTAFRNRTIYKHTITKQLVYSGNNLSLSLQEINLILKKYYPYYINLNPFQKENFAKRLQAFMQQKIFTVYADEAFKEMPVLLSAAAIQITFGLNDYMLPHYKNIRIHPEEYFAENSLRVLAGNVQGNAITIAWNQFLKGILEPNDGVNVGLHEMAHALYYQHIIANNLKESSFCNCFEEVMEEGAEVYELKHKHHSLFTKYAFKNLQEFWAESVELFFEKPAHLQSLYPDLFDAMKELLNQNPMNSSNPVLMA